jgi:hypothetical protein
MDLNRRQMLRNGLALGGATLLARPSFAAPSTRANNFGLVELSTSGVTSILYRLSKAMLDAPRGLSGYERLAPRPASKPTAPVRLPLAANADAAAIDECARLIAAQVDLLMAQWDVRRANVAILASSGVAGYAGPALPALREAVFARTRVPINVVTPRDEARLQFDWVVTGAKRGRVLQLDVGSGNTKGGYYDRQGRNGRYLSLAVPYGSKTMAAAVKGRWPETGTFDFPQRSADFYRETVTAALDQELAALPQARQMSELMITGGIVWAAANILHPQEMIGRSDWVELAPDDFARLGKLVERGAPYGNVPEALKGDARARLLKTRSTIRNIFNPHQIAAGAALVDGLSHQLDFAGRKKLLFPTFANNSWRTQYLIERFVEGRSRVS